MKNNFKTPELEIIYLNSVDDVVCTSGEADLVNGTASEEMMS